MTKENTPFGGLALEPMTVTVDLEKLNEVARTHQSTLICSTTAYALDGFLAKGDRRMPYELFGRIVADLKVNPHDILPDPEQHAAPTPEWSATIEVVGDRLKMTVSHNGEEMVYGKSYVQDTDDFGMMQAISYAAHMCYKMVQQKNM